MIKTCNFLIPGPSKRKNEKNLTGNKKRKCIRHHQTTGEVEVNIKKGNGSDKNRRGQGSDNKNEMDQTTDEIRSDKSKGKDPITDEDKDYKTVEDKD